MQYIIENKETINTAFVIEEKGINITPKDINVKNKNNPDFNQELELGNTFDKLNELYKLPRNKDKAGTK
jgi:hypothetical protein